MFSTFLNVLIKELISTYPARKAISPMGSSVVLNSSLEKINALLNDIFQRRNAAVFLEKVRQIKAADIQTAANVVYTSDIGVIFVDKFFRLHIRFVGLEIVLISVGENAEYMAQNRFDKAVGNVVVIIEFSFGFRNQLRKIKFQHGRRVSRMYDRGRAFFQKIIFGKVFQLYLMYAEKIKGQIVSRFIMNYMRVVNENIAGIDL